MTQGADTYQYLFHNAIKMKGSLLLCCLTPLQTDVTDHSWSTTFEFAAIGCNTNNNQRDRGVLPCRRPHLDGPVSV